MMKYKVVKTHDVFFKGDVFTRNSDDTYSCETVESNNGYKYSSKITVSKQCMLDAIAQGIVQIVDDQPKVKDVIDNKKNNDAVKELDRLINQYNVDMDHAQKMYEQGSTSAMQHAESITVLSNLIRLAEHIKNILK